jgi:hypothetical protein
MPILVPVESPLVDAGFDVCVGIVPDSVVDVCDGSSAICRRAADAGVKCGRSPAAQAIGICSPSAAKVTLFCAVE